MIDIDELKHSLKDHYLFVTGRRNGKRANFTGKFLSKLNFNGINMQSIIAQMTDFSECSFVETYLRHSDFFLANLEKANFKKCNLFKSDLRGMRMHADTLTEANLEDADLRAGTFSFGQRKGQGAVDMTRAVLDSARLHNAMRDGAKLGGASYVRTNFIGASMPEVDWSGADLKDANLSYAKLKNAVLSGANLKGESLIGADLRGPS